MLLRILIIYCVLSLPINAIILYLMWKVPRGHETRKRDITKTKQHNDYS